MRALGIAAVLLLLLVVSVHAAEVPLHDVTLFSSGVGYFHRQGTVSGNTEVTLSFKVEQINDLLKTLVLEDRNGGTIRPVTYASQDPLARALASFPIDVTYNKSLQTLLWDLRGTEIIVTAGTEIRGRIIGVNTQEAREDDLVFRRYFLLLLTDQGMVRLPLEEIRYARLADPELNGQLEDALRVMGDSLRQDKRDLHLQFDGSGQRQVGVGYLLETPVWKTTYRLVADEDNMFLQGWAIVENTTDSDWEDIQLALVSGRPVTFRQNLYEPVYAFRPEVPVPLPPAVTPRTYEGAFGTTEDEAEAPPPMEKAYRAVGYAGAPAMMGPPGQAGPAGPVGDIDSLMAGITLDLGVAAASTGEEVGEFFQYEIDQRVSIPRQQSAMIPIINGDISGEKLSVYTPNANAQHPLHGVRLKNDTGLHLMAGAITVFQDGAYAGDAMINDLGRGDSRLLTYALDLGVEVKRDLTTDSGPQYTLVIDNGVLTATHKLTRKTEYTLANQTEDPRRILVEHAQQSQWDLVGPEPEETSRNQYRFLVEVPANSIKTLVVEEVRPQTETVALIDNERLLNRLDFYLTSVQITPQVKAALQEIVRQRVAIAEVVRERQDKEARLKEIAAEQTRIRSNMDRLDRNSELYRRYVSKLNAQEDEYESLQVEIVELEEREERMTDTLHAYIRGLKLGA